MGVNSLMKELFYGSQQVSQIGRAYLQQSIALVFICRRLVPHVGLEGKQVKELEEAINSLNNAFKLARGAGRQQDKGVQTVLDGATSLVLRYLGTYHHAQEVMDDIAEQLKLLTGPETAPADVKLAELREKDQQAVQQLQYLPLRLKSKLKSLSARTQKIEVWVWPAKLDPSDQDDVHRPKMVFEEDALLDHVLCRVLDHTDHFTLAQNPQFYSKFLDDKPNEIEYWQPSTKVSLCPQILHLVVDRRWRLVFDIPNGVQVFGNVINFSGRMVLKNKLGDLIARELLDVDKNNPLSFYSCPEIRLKEEVTWSSVIEAAAAEIPISCDVLASRRVPEQFPEQLPFKALEWKLITSNNNKLAPAPPPNASQDTLPPLRGNPSGSVIPPRTKPNPQPPNAPTKTSSPGPGKKKGISGGRLQNVAQGVDFISSDMAPISQTFREEPKPTKKPKGWFGRMFG